MRYMTERERIPEGSLGIPEFARHYCLSILNKV
jgi:hypothetical protein